LTSTTNGDPAAREDRVAGTQTIGRALAILGLLRDSKGGLALTDVSRALSLHMSTAHRILRALVSAGYVTQNTEERYRLGREAYLLGQAAQRELGFDIVVPLLKDLALRTGESANLVVRDGNEALVVLRVESSQPLRFTQPTGTRIPLHCTSTGKALLAFSPDPAKDVEDLGELEQFTPDTITSPRELLRDLEAVRLRGYSTNVGERVRGVCGVAAPVLGNSGELIAAVAVQGPSIRMPADRLDELGQLMVETAEEIAHIVPGGYRI
jgi:IclR family transcriptional regulator, acetate operon repressor